MKTNNKFKMAFALITTTSFLSVVNPNTEKALVGKNSPNALVNIKDINRWDNQIRSDFGYVNSSTKEAVQQKSMPSSYHPESRYDAYRQNDFIATSLSNVRIEKANMLPSQEDVKDVFDVENIEDEIKLLPNSYEIEKK